MQTNAESMSNPQPDASGASGTVAAGLAAWMGDAHVEPDTAASPSVGARDDVPASGAIAETAEPATASVDPVNAAETLVLGTAGSAQRLTGPDGAELVIDPECDKYYFESTSLKPLAALLQQPVDQWQPVYSKALADIREAGAPQPLERLRWYAGLIATPAVLDRRLSRNAPYKLARWPQTEREFPKHFRVAKAMFNKAATLEQIAEESSVSYDDVVDYINASHAAGRLVDDTPAAAEAASPATSRKSRLIAVLNKPLFTR